MSLIDEINRYSWYHTIEVEPGVYTPGEGSAFSPIWSFIRSELARVDFKNKSVLDIGCRDGLFSLVAESKGAARVQAIDNDLSRGATEFLLPYMKSKIVMQEKNLMDFDPSQDADIVMCFGLLYHLRYPIYAIRRMVDCLAPRGLLLIETGIATKIDQSLPLMLCPVEASPYERTSCAFFNPVGLVTTVESFGMTCERGEVMVNSLHNGIERGFFAFRKTHEMRKFLRDYWDREHTFHTTGKM